MRVEVKVPQLPESVAEATLVNWHKKIGEAVSRDENLVDVETDKVVLELPAPVAGVLAEIRKGDGATVAGQEVIAVLDSEAAAASTVAASASAAPAAAATPQQAPAPRTAAAPSAAPPPSPPLRRLVATGNRAAGRAEDDGGSGRQSGRRSWDRTRGADHQGRCRRNDRRATAAAAKAEPRRRRLKRLRPLRARPQRRRLRRGPPRQRRPQHWGSVPEQRVPMSRLRQRVAERLVNRSRPLRSSPRSTKSTCSR
jgi:2-oxoglutarate dehydrogenase E2 component (dihydrolipoamide succinyltransferase)